MFCYIITRQIKAINNLKRHISAVAKQTAGQQDGKWFEHVEAPETWTNKSKLKAKVTIIQ